MDELISIIFFREVGILDLETGNMHQMIGKSSFKNLDTIECTENICILINQEHSTTNEKFVYLTMNIYIKPNKVLELLKSTNYNEKSSFFI